MQPSYINLLSISSHAKEIPYSRTASKQVSERVNYGFKNLITHPELINAIPELASDQALKSLVFSLNFDDTCFFTTGCFSHESREECGYRYSGYIEFAWNCQILVRDAIHYFSLFFHFEQFLRTHSFEQRIRFHWFIEETQFLDGNIAGFCCAIVIDTEHCSSSDRAYHTWEAALKLLESFLDSVPVQTSLAIYECCSSRFSSSKFSASCLD